MSDECCEGSTAVSGSAGVVGSAAVVASAGVAVSYTHLTLPTTPYV